MLEREDLIIKSVKELDGITNEPTLKKGMEWVNDILDRDNSASFPNIVVPNEKDGFKCLIFIDREHIDATTHKAKGFTYNIDEPAFSEEESIYILDDCGKII